MNDYIDAVVYWVDGNDPKHRMKRKAHLHEIVKDTMPCAALEGRFYEANEIRYCLFSIRKFAPWIRKIFLVTDEQCPTWLDDASKNKLGVSVIDHKVIFRDYLQYLPTFNNMSISSLVWTIPGLSNKYIVFNDDIFLVDRCSPEHFFVNDQTVVRGRWRKNKIPGIVRAKRAVRHILRNRSFKDIPWNVSNPFVNGAKYIGYSNDHFETAHAPHSYLKSVLEKYYSENKDMLEENIRHRFRNRNQMPPAVIFTHLILKHGRALVQDGSDSLMIIPDKDGLTRHRSSFYRLKKDFHGIRFLCFQDMSYLKDRNPGDYREATDLLDKIVFS